MATEYKIIFDPDVKKIMKDYGFTFSNNDIF